MCSGPLSYRASSKASPGLLTSPPRYPPPCFFPAAALLLFPTVDVLPVVDLLPPTADQSEYLQPSLLLCRMAASLAVNALTGWAQCDDNYID